ncbi:MAG: hypothetical protein JWN46_619 [Acidimicrobiales bacterium]|nr:hypothetical protein [Acidimicrobiales bacterium]
MKVGSVPPPSTPETAVPRLAAASPARLTAVAGVEHGPARRDALTGLLDRHGLIGELDRRTASGGPAMSSAAVLLLDIDDFRLVNEALGLVGGDELIVRSADVLQQVAHPGDIVGRFAGDSFVVCCGHGLDEARAERYAEQLRGALARVVRADGYELDVCASAGIVVSEGATSGAHELVQQAETALARAKEEGKDRSWLYDEALWQCRQRQLQVVALVRTIVSAGDVELAYQPGVRLADQAIIGAEALLRVVDEDGAPVPAAELVAAAESSGSMRALGQIVLRSACREAARWKQAVPERRIAVAVNLSASQLADPRLPADVAAALQSSGLEPSRLCLEIAESVLMEDPARSTRQLAQLHMRGVHLSVDDFGTGFSSLASLERLPLDSIKADRSFVVGLPDRAEDLSIISAMMGVAAALGLNVGAVGIENDRQLSALLALGCGYGQGHLWSRAVSGAELLALVESGGHEVAVPEVTLPAQVEATRLPDQGSTEGEALDSAFHTLAHEIRTPLTLVMGYASLLEETPDLESAEYATSIRKAGERIRRLVRNLEEARDIDAGTFVLERAPVAVRPMVERVVEDLCGAMGAAIELEVAADADVEALLDEASIEQVLVNLVVNAKKYGPASVAPAVRVDRSGDWVDISVADDGPGIAHDQLGLIFRKYGRLDHSIPGTGLGLYLARGTARAHGGEILYRRRHPQHGSVFTLRVPVLAAGRVVE